MSQGSDQLDFAGRSLPGHRPADPQQDSLPLFGPIPGELGAAESSNADRGAPGPQIVNRHLKAARTLSKKMRQFRERSPEQTVAGRAICQHLRAYLRETEAGRTGGESTTPH